MKNKHERSEVLKVIGKNIKQARRLKGMTQDALSESIDTSTNFISLIECGKSGVSLTNLVDICNVLQIDTSAVFSGLVTANDTTEAEQIINTLSMFEDEDKAIVSDLIKYISNSKMK